MGTLKRIKAFQSEYFYYTGKDYLRFLMWGTLVICGLDYFFFRSLWGIVVLLPFADFFLSIEIDRDFQRKRNKAKEEFLELLLLLSNSLRAGYSFENAMEQSYPRILKLFKEDAAITKLLNRAVIAKRNNASVSKVFIESGLAMDIQDITEFGEIYEIAHERSGNLTKIMDQTAESIMERINLQKELYLELSERTFEMKIMCVMPFVIMIYVELTSPGYFDAMYHSFDGAAGMLICLIIYTFSYGLGHRFMRIEV